MESRHSIVEPKRSDSGRRFYNDQHVERLGLVKRLMGEGHSLAELSKLSTEDLTELGVRHDQSAQPRLPECVDIVGLNLVPRLREAKPSLASDIELSNEPEQLVKRPCNKYRYART